MTDMREKIRENPNLFTGHLIYMLFNLYFLFNVRHFFLLSSIVARNSTIKMNKWDDRSSNPDPLHI
jgi:hypothetical protein